MFTSAVFFISIATAGGNCLGKYCMEMKNNFLHYENDQNKGQSSFEQWLHYLGYVFGVGRALIQTDLDFPPPHPQKET